MICLECGAEMKEFDNFFNCPRCINFHIKDSIPLNEPATGILELKESLSGAVIHILKSLKRLDERIDELENNCAKECRSIREKFDELEARFVSIERDVTNLQEPETFE